MDIPLSHFVVVMIFCHVFLESFAYLNIARLAAPLRIAVALSSTSWIQEKILGRFSPQSIEKTYEKADR
jgi:hypothetical protein